MLFQFGPKPYVPGGPSISGPPAAQTHVLLAFGQSNMVDQSGNDNAVAWPANVRVMETETQTYPAASSPLKWLESIPGISANWQSGPGQLVKHFAIEWSAANPDDTLIVVPAARGGTGFLGGDWLANGSGRLYNETIRLLDKAFADHPEAGFLAMLAQHGERDAENRNRTYRWNALQMIARIRDRYGVPALPVIWGEPGPAAQFANNTTASHDAVRAQIRSLPGQTPHVATVREESPAVFDALTDLDNLHFDRASQKVLGGLHHGALATARANTATSLPDVALIWQTAGEQNPLDFDVPCADLQVGDRLIVLAGAHRSSGNPYLTGLTAGGDAATLHRQEMVIQTTRIGLSIASVEVSAVPANGILPFTLSWGSNPTGRSIAIWRQRGGSAPGAGSFGHSANLGPLSVDLTARLPGTVLMLGYAVDTGAEIVFTGSGTAEVEGPGNTNAVYFTTRESGEAGAVATLTLTPSKAPSHVCGMVAVAVG